MLRKLTLALQVVLLLGVVQYVPAFPMQVDIGDSGQAVKPGWQAFTGDGNNETDPKTVVYNVDGTSVSVSVRTGVINDSGYRDYGGGALGADMVYPDNENGSVDGRVILTLGNLPAGNYTLTSYHNDTKSSHDQQDPIDVVVSGAITAATGQTNVIQTKSSDDNGLGSSTVTFTASGTGDVVITYIPTTNNGLVSKAVLNGFELDLSGTTVRFAQASSSCLENAGPAAIDVVLSSPAEETVTVDYAVVIGTAVNGQDYFLDNGTLTFDVGQTSRVIVIGVAYDDSNEPSETVELIVYNPTNATLGGTTEHVFTILPPGAEICPRGDIDGDCTVDFNDVGILGLQWLDELGVCIGSDPSCANLDGIYGVDLRDFAVLAADWQRGLGSMQVDISPQAVINAGGQWRIVGGSTWHDSGHLLQGLEYGGYAIEYAPVAGWTEPVNQVVQIDNCTTEIVVGAYIRLIGNLIVNLYPSQAIDAGARWRVLGTETWRSSGYTEMNLPVGPCVVEFRSAPGWTKPETQIVQINAGQTTATDGTYTVVSYTSLVINEFMAKNDSFITDADRDLDDWIEIYNAGATLVDMAGMYLTDDLDEPTKWQIPLGSPAETTIEPNGYLLFWADGEPDEGPLHGDFKLSAGGEAVGLFDPNQNLVDAMVFGVQEGNKSYGRLPDGNISWVVFSDVGGLPPTPAGENGSVPDEVIINEIMYHPSMLPYSDLEDYIELYNRGCCAVDLSGWKFIDGVDFTFPVVTLEPNEYIVVAADVNMFTAKYPGVTNVVGGWTGRLSNGGEKVELLDDSGILVDWIRYADEGDWSYREQGPLDHGYYGWVWADDHDGEGKSLELMNPDMPGDYGQNWSASVPVGGTPGIINSVISNNIAPLILDVAHMPEIPGPADSVTVTARLMDEFNTGITGRVRYRVNGAPSFSTADMYDDGLHNDGDVNDGIYAGTIPAQTDGAVVELYVEAEDVNSNVRAWPGATEPSGLQLTNMLYQVDDSFDPNAQWDPNDQPMHYLILTESERADLEDLGDDGGDEQYSNAQMNATFISVGGTGIRVRYNVGVRNRGHGSRHEPPMNYRVNFPHDRPWKDITAVNLNSKFAHLQWLGSASFELAGMASTDAVLIQVRVNGENLILDDSRAHGSYALYEEKNSDWAGNHVPNDSDGNIYRCIREDSGNQADLRYEGTDPDAYRDTYYKKANEEVDDWNDLINLTDVLNNAPDETYLEDVSEVINIEQWMRYLAFDTLLLNCESGLNTGQGDDYGMYRGVDDPRFVLIPHDQDTYLIEGDHQECVETHNIFTYDQVDGLYRLMNHPDTVVLYYQAFFDLFETAYNADVFGPLMQETLGRYLPQSMINDMLNVVINRTSQVLLQIPHELTVNCSLATSSGFYRTTSSSSVLLSGEAHAGQTRSVMVNGAEANWDARYGTWSLSSLPLNPGINRIAIQAFDGKIGTGNEVESASIDIWYDDSSESTISGVLVDAITVLDAASGPWRVTGTVTVGAGKTLEIEAGTSVFFDSGAGITVNGRLVADGSEYQRIRLGPVPGGSAWAGLSFSNTTEDSQLNYVDMVSGDTQGESISISYSKLSIDNVTWSGTNSTVLEVSHPSLVVSNSVFPSISGELIHGSSILTGGEFVLESNVFNTGSGNNDVIDFSDCQRPDPIFEVYNNIFLGGDDDGLDLDGTDSHIEGNVFTNFHYDGGETGGTASAIATGQSGGDTSDIVAVRNVFYDNDHVALLKEGCFMDGQHNVFAMNNIAVINFDEPGHAAGPGLGTYLQGNIFWNNIDLFQNFYSTGDVTIDRSILPSVDHLHGTGNIDADPLFVDYPDDFTLKTPSPAIGSADNGLDMGAMVADGAAISGEPDDITHRTDATLSVGGPGITRYKYKVNDGSWSGEFAIDTDPTIDLSGLINGQSYTVFVIGKNSAGRWQNEADATASRTWMVDIAHWKLVINEVLADANDGSADLIELYYDGPATLDMSGMKISDDDSVPTKFVFELGTTMNPDEYMVLVADGNTAEAGHVSFAIDFDGGGIYLYDSASVGLDSVEFGKQFPGLSIGRFGPDGDWTLTQPTFGSANASVPLGDPQTLKINEWLTSNEVLFSSDFIEIYNPHPAPVDMGGMFMTDDPISRPYRHQMTPLTFVPGGSFTTFSPDGNVEDGPKHLNFGLSAKHEMIGLFDIDGALIDQVIFYAQATNISQGRKPDGGDDFEFFDLPTPGISNVTTAGTADALALIDALRITEMMYNPVGTSEDTEFIELHNISAGTLNLSGVRFTKGVSYEFGADVNIPAGGYVVVVNDPVAFKALYAGVSNGVIFGPYDGQLDNGGEELVLKVASPYEAAVMRFDYSDSWYPDTDGDGFTLGIIDPTIEAIAWDESESWTSTAPTPAAP